MTHFLQRPHLLIVPPHLEGIFFQIPQPRFVLGIFPCVSKMPVSISRHHFGLKFSLRLIRSCKFHFAENSYRRYFIPSFRFQSQLLFLKTKEWQRVETLIPQFNSSTIFKILCWFTLSVIKDILETWKKRQAIKSMQQSSRGQSSLQICDWQLFVTLAPWGSSGSALHRSLHTWV